MSAFTILAAKKGFFDSAKVKRSVDAGTRKALSKFGAFVRQRARTSIRKRKGTSPPGSPPFSHTGTLRRGILFAYDATKRSVVIGPVLLGRQTGAPESLEYGGFARIEGRRPRTARVAPRPYMGPAFAAELPKAAGLFKDMIR